MNVAKLIVASVFVIFRAASKDKGSGITLDPDTLDLCDRCLKYLKKVFK